MAWAQTLPELAGVTAAAMDPLRIEQAMREGYAKGHSAGLADGQEAGYQAGHAAGESDGRAALDAARQQLSAVAVRLGEQLALLADVERQVRDHFQRAAVDAAITLAEAIIGRELAVAEDPGRDAILRAFAVAPTGATNATVRLHPHDADRLGDVDGIDPTVELTVLADPAVEPGSCVLQLGDTSVDASISAAIARVREELG